MTAAFLKKVFFVCVFVASARSGAQEVAACAQFLQEFPVNPKVQRIVRLQRDILELEAEIATIDRRLSGLRGGWRDTAVHRDAAPVIRALFSRSKSKDARQDRKRREEAQAERESLQSSFWSELTEWVAHHDPEFALLRELVESEEQTLEALRTYLLRVRSLQRWGAITLATEAADLTLAILDFPALAFQVFSTASHALTFRANLEARVGRAHIEEAFKTLQRAWTEDPAAHDRLNQLIRRLPRPQILVELGDFYLDIVERPYAPAVSLITVARLVKSLYEVGRARREARDLAREMEDRVRHRRDRIAYLLCELEAVCVRKATHVDD